MSMIRSKNTKPEVFLKKLLKGTYLRYQPKMYGRPDFALRSKKIVIFVDGCFWHKCPVCFKRPKSNHAYWDSKFTNNITRDKKVNSHYKRLNYRVVRIWEHQLKKNPMRVVKKILKLLD